MKFHFSGTEAARQKAFADIPILQSSTSCCDSAHAGVVQKDILDALVL